jgi:hypothetical protein
MVYGEGVNRNVSHPTLVMKGIPHGSVVPFGRREIQGGKVLEFTEFKVEQPWFGVAQSFGLQWRNDYRLGRMAFLHVVTQKVKVVIPGCFHPLDGVRSKFRNFYLGIWSFMFINYYLFVF